MLYQNREPNPFEYLFFNVTICPFCGKAKPFNCFPKNTVTKVLTGMASLPCSSCGNGTGN